MRHAVKNSGFTLVEVLVVAPIVILSIGAFIAVVIALTGNTMASRSATLMQYSIQDALERIEQDTRLSSRFLSVNDISLSATNPQGYVNDQESTPNSGSTVNFTNIDKTATGGSTAALVIRQPAVDSNPLKNAANSPVKLIYLINTPANCSGDYKQNTLMYTNIVYFVANNSLWRRVITPTNYATPSSFCGATEIYQRPSCAPSTSHTYCRTEDSKLVSDVAMADFNVDYWTNTDTDTAANKITAAKEASSTDSVRNTALEAATTITVNIKAKGSFAGRDVEQSGSVKSVLLNRL